MFVKCLISSLFPRLRFIFKIVHDCKKMHDCFSVFTFLVFYTRLVDFGSAHDRFGFDRVCTALTISFSTLCTTDMKMIWDMEVRRFKCRRNHFKRLCLCSESERRCWITVRQTICFNRRTIHRLPLSIQNLVLSDLPCARSRTEFM